MKILCVFGKHNYGDPSRGEGYEYANFIPALKGLGHEVSFFESLNRNCYEDFLDLNQKFLNAVQVQQPDIIFSALLGYEIWLDTLESVREKSKALLINWGTDDSWKYDQFSRFLAPAFDVYATTSSAAFHKARNDGHQNFVLTQWAASTDSLAEPLPADKCRYQVTFVGTAYGNRSRWIRRLKDSGIEVECFGHGWNRGPLRAEEVKRVMRESVISLNFGDSGLHMVGLAPYRSRQIKARVFEIPGAGGFLMTENAEGLRDFYRPDQEVIVFDGIEDLRDKISYFLDHEEERNNIAFRGYERTFRDHTYDKRFQELFRVGLHYQTAVSPQKRIGMNRKEAQGVKSENLARRHRAGRLLKMFKLSLQFPCIILWGRQRGPRAARRLLFEISWRLVGRKTYTASGLAGRLFYRES